MQTIEWIKAHELPTGGIEAWDGLGKPYPEVTGYLIPTLLDYGETELAERLGDWLESVQNKDGSFDGLDGIPRAFDTAACYEGLRMLDRPAADRALVWLKSQIFGDGKIHTSPEQKYFDVYNYRALALMGEKQPNENITGTRTHYHAYALEGFYRMGNDITAELERYAQYKSLLPMNMTGGGTDTSATAHIAVLCLKNSIPCNGLIDAVRAQVDTDGGVFHDSGDRRKCSWAAKFYLDMEFLCQTTKSTGKTGKTKKSRSA